jgi:hypothetical protein
MASQLSVTFAAGANRPLAMRKLQTIVDGAVAPLTTIRALESGSAADLDFPAEVAEEQVQACFRAAVNMAGLPESGFEAGTAVLTGVATSGSQQRVYSV